MLLAIDAGNTNIVFAIFDRKVLVRQWRFSTNPKRTADEYAVNLLQLMALENVPRNSIGSAIISTVVPAALFALRKLCKEYFNCEALVVGQPDVAIDIEIKIDRASEVGADRLVNSLAAYKQFGGNVIIIDFGTATTFDVIDQDGCYRGGVISPGINLSLDALHMAAAKLPKIAVERPKKVIGTSTVSAMQAGIYWGYVGLIEGIIKRVEGEYGSSMKKVATGGLAALFFREMDIIQFLEPDLTMVGLQYIYEMNRGTHTVP